MSMFSSVLTTKGGTSLKTFVNNELAQLIIALALIACFMVMVLTGADNTAFVGGALSTLLGYYFGGKNTTNATTSAANAVTAAVVATPNSNQGEVPK